MKTYLRLFLVIVQFNLLNAQNTISKELSVCTDEIANLESQIQYYKNALDLLKPIQSVTIDHLQLDIVNVVGNKKEETVKITFTYKNKKNDYRRFFQCEQAYFVNPDGEQFQSYEVIVSSTNDIRAEHIKENIPYRGIIQFKNIKTNAPIIRLLTIALYSEIESNVLRAEFENLKVDWN